MSGQIIGVQSLIFGGHYNLERDLDTVLGVVARAGYEAIESGTSDSGVFRQALAVHGLKHAGLHVTLDKLRDPTPQIEYLRVTGAKDICNSGLLRWGNLTLDDYREAIPILNEAGRRFKDAGLDLHYHNHDFEFLKVAGEATGMDILFDGLNPDYLDFCVDVAWVDKGGLQPSQFLREHNDRIGYIHLKDYDESGWTELGKGVVDFHSIIPVLPELHRVKWVIVEQDSTKLDPYESISISRRFLRDQFGL